MFFILGLCVATQLSQLSLLAMDNGRMDRLAGLDISPNIPKLDFLTKLKRIDVRTLKGIRNDLFDAVKTTVLVHQHDVLMDRRYSAARPAARKLAEDIWDLLACIQLRKSIPRALLKADKCSKLCGLKPKEQRTL